MGNLIVPKGISESEKKKIEADYYLKGVNNKIE